MESREAVYDGLLIRPVGGGLVELTGWLFSLPTSKPPRQRFE